DAPGRRRRSRRRCPLPTSPIFDGGGVLSHCPSPPLPRVPSPMAKRRVLHDRFFTQAKAEGYLARSAYKLIEIDDKFRILPRRGGLVLDLGAAPGSWTQVASERMGPNGRIVALDIQEIRVSLPNA